jgi:phosphonate transport system ATP-binding protein
MGSLERNASRRNEKRGERGDALQKSLRVTRAGCGLTPGAGNRSERGRTARPARRIGLPVRTDGQRANMLEIRSLTKQFGTLRAVDDVSLSIEEGAMVGIIGRSGAGKSTLLRLINRLATPTQGAIRFNKTEVSNLKGKALRSWQGDCAMIFQQFNLVPRLDVLTNVMLGRLNHIGTLRSAFKLFTDQERLEALQALERLGIEQTALQQAGTLSGGQQQRVAIARALVQKPKLILADEPIASLDPMNAQLVMDALKRINEEDGITVVSNLHTLDTARTYCKRIVGMSAGRVVFDGDPAALTTAQAREIYGAGDEFNEAATSTSISREGDTESAAKSPDAETDEPSAPGRVVNL